MSTQLPQAWYSIELKGYRNHPEPYRAYSPFPYDQLPELPNEAFDGTFSWLQVSANERSESRSNRVSKVEDILRNLEQQARSFGLVIPEAFLSYMRDDQFFKQLRSATGCSIDLAERLVELPGKSGWLLRFFADSQGCLFWYLFLEQNACHCVVVTNECFGGHPFEDGEFMERHLGPDWNHEDSPSETLKVSCCAPHFEAFMYRVWIENEIWYALNEGGLPVTMEQQKYLNHYVKFSS